MLLRQEEVISTTKDLLKDIRNYVHRYERDLKWIQSKVDKKTFLKIFLSLKKILAKSSLLQIQLENFIQHKNSIEDPEKLANAFISACILAGVKKSDVKSIKLIRDIIVNKIFLTKNKRLTNSELSSLNKLINDETIEPFFNFAAICQSHMYEKYLDAWIKFQALDQAMLHSLDLIDEFESRIYFKKNILDEIKLFNSSNDTSDLNIKTELNNCDEEKFVLENTYKQLVAIKKEYAKKISEFDCSPQSFNETAQKLYKIIEIIKKSNDPSIAKIAKEISKTIKSYIGEHSKTYFGQTVPLAA